MSNFPDIINSPLLPSWLSVFLSSAAILVAIGVPKAIAQKQNQIAVFDKLFSSYAEFLKIYEFSQAIREYRFSGKSIDVLNTRNLFCLHFEPCFGYKPDIRNGDKSIGTALAALRKNELCVHMIPLLISKKQKDNELSSNMINAIYESAFFLLTEVIFYSAEEAESTNAHLREFVKNTEAFHSAYAEKIENQLILRK